MANKELHERCTYRGEFRGPTDLITLEPNPFDISTLDAVPSARLQSIELVPALMALAEKADLNLLIDSTTGGSVYGDAYEVSWSHLFHGLVRAHGFAIAPSCHAVAIGNPKIMTIDPFRVAEEADGKKIKLRNCENNEVYTGRKHSFSFDKTPIEDALAQISVLSNLNFILAANVKGSISGRLREVPWDETLDLILSLFGLDKFQTGSLVRIDSVENLRAEREAQKESICTCCSVEDVKRGKTKNLSEQKAAK